MAFSRITRALITRQRRHKAKVDNETVLSLTGIHCTHFRLYSQYKLLTNSNGWYHSYESKRKLWSISNFHKLRSSYRTCTESKQAQIMWKKFLQLRPSGQPVFSHIANAAGAVSFALYRSNLKIPAIFGLIAGELMHGETSLADAEQFPTTTSDTLYRHAENGKVYVTSLVILFIDAIILFLRVIYLTAIFTPCIAMAPFADSLGAEFRITWLEILHHTLERAGPAFIKWGQWAATRPDLFPRDLCAELAKLHTHAPAHGFAFTKRTIEKAFGRRLHDIFERFEEKPVASGSIAQVHRAVLKFRYPGRPAKPILVAVKVRHPGVAEAIRRDFLIINFFGKISKFIPTLKWLRLDESLQQFAVFMMSQVDLAREAAHLSRFIYNFRRWKDVSFPKPLYPLVHPAVLVETFEHGDSILYYVDELEGNHRIKSALAQIGSDALLKMLLVDNFIHADMHPGNILVRVSRQNTKPTGRQPSSSRPHVVFLDVGMTAEMSKRDRTNLIEFFKAVALRDGRTAAECTLKLSERQSCPNPGAFIEEVDNYFNFWGSPEGYYIHPADCMQQLLELVRRHRVNIDGNVCTVIVTTLVLEGWQRKLDPDYNVMQALKSLLFKVDLTESLSYTLEGLAAP